MEQLRTLAADVRSLSQSILALCEAYAFDSAGPFDTETARRIRAVKEHADDIQRQVEALAA